LTTARTILGGTLTFWLNKLSPGETLDADLGAICLAALNDVADGFNGLGSFLFREVLTPGVCNGVSGTLGTTWVGVNPGDNILGATVSYQAGMELPLDPITMGQYADISQKATASIPQYFCPDGGSLVFLWPAAAGQTVTLRTWQSFTSFADLDTDYLMPQGFLSAFAVCAAERMAVSLVGAIPAAVEVGARAARNRLAAQVTAPEIINMTKPLVGNILTGWR
jgi:hypothetical protein